MKQKVICLFMVVLLVVGAATPKKAYAVAGVDDAAVVIVCALLAAAGVTFASNDGVQDAVQGFLDASDGRYDTTIERLASGYSVYGSVGAFKIPTMAMGGVRLLLEGLFDYFSVDDNRCGAVIVPGIGNFCPVIDTLGGSYEYKNPVSSPFLCFLIADPSSFYNPEMHFFYFKPDGLYHSSWYKYTSGYVPRKPNKTEKLVSCSPSSSSSISWSGTLNNFSVILDGESIYTNTSVGLFSAANTSLDTRRLCFMSSLSFVREQPYPSDLADFGSKYLSVAYDQIDFLDMSNVIGWVSSAEKSVPYGLTFPEEISASDVIDNFEQRVEAAAGDLAIVVPVDGVVDNTLPYVDAQDQYLVNVNELGEVTDSQVETNTWLQKLLVAVKSIPATLINLLEALLVKLFSPSDAVLQGGFDGLLGAFREKTDYQTYMDLLSRFQSLSEPDLADLKVNWYGTEYTVVTWDFFRRTKAIYSRWLRGFLYLFLLLFNFNNIYKLIRNGSLFNGSGHRGETGKGKGE